MIIVDYSTFRHHFATAAAVDVAGYEVWPVAKVRSGGFSGLQATLPTTLVSDPNTAFPFTITCNAEASDAVKWTDEYDWYLSQRTDDPNKQMLTLYRIDNMPATTESGRCGLTLTAVGLNAYPTLGAEKLHELFADVTVYVKRRSDNAIDLGKCNEALESDV